MSTCWVILHIFAVLLLCDYGMFYTLSPSSTERTTHEIKKDDSGSRTEGADSIFLIIAFIPMFLLLCTLHFLRKKRRMNSSLYIRPHTKNWTEIRIDFDVNVNSLYRALTQLKKTHKTLNKKLSQTGLKFVQKFAVDVTLDPDTAYSYLILSYDGKQVSHGDIKQNVPKNPKRFDKGPCVLAKQGFSSGRFYYEVQVKGKTQWGLGVIRESINRKGEITGFPNSQNGVWILVRFNKNQYAVCDNPLVMFLHRETLEKVRVFVDYEEGLVSFYNVDSRSHIYSFTGQTFTEKLYPFFSPGRNDRGKNSNPLIITPVN